MMRRRRELLIGAAGAALSAWRVPALAAMTQPRSTRRLVLFELKGGNDGLNCFPPLRDPLYRSLRPTVALPPSAIHPLGGDRGLHPAMASLRLLWERGEFAIVDGVGSPSPDLSHFWAAQQWETGRADKSADRLGWLAGALREAAEPAALQSGAHAAVIGFNSGPLSGGGLKLIELSASALAGQASMPSLMSPTTAQSHLTTVLKEWQASQQLLSAPVSLPEPEVPFPGWGFDQDLRQLAQLMVQDPELRVFKIVLDGFDTHTHQVSPTELDQGRHYKLLRKMSESLAALASQLRRLDLWRDTVIASYSEFGRRPAENGAHGTDHGTANSLFLLGGPIRGGFHGQPLDLADLDADGNPRVSLDFRDYFDALATDVLGLASQPLLPDRRSRLDLI